MRHTRPTSNLVGLGTIIGASGGMLIGTLFMGSENIGLAIAFGAALGVVATTRSITRPATRRPASVATVLVKRSPVCGASWKGDR